MIEINDRTSPSSLTKDSLVRLYCIFSGQILFPVFFLVLGANVFGFVFSFLVYLKVIRGHFLIEKEFMALRIC